MATTKQRKAARRNVRKAAAGAKKKRSIASMPKKTRNELMKIAARRGLRGRSKMGRAQLARKLGVR